MATFLENKCRACLKTIVESCDLFEDYQDGISLAEIANAFLENELSETDFGPRTFCMDCVNVLVSFNNFLNTLNQSTVTLNKIREKINVDCNKNSNETFGNIKTSTVNNNDDVVNSNHENDFICHVCGKTFKKASFLKEHMDSHSTTANYKCTMCPKMLNSRSGLIRHKKSHKHIFICEVCGDKFTYISSLARHKYLKHNNEKKFKCCKCGLDFALKANLYKHIQRHNNRENGSLKPFKCDKCKCEYSDKSSLTRHLKDKHKLPD